MDGGSSSDGARRDQNGLCDNREHTWSTTATPLGLGVTKAMTSTMAAMEELGAHGEDDPRSWSLLWRTPKSSVVHKDAIGAAGIDRRASTELNRRRRSELRGGEDALWRSVLDISGQNRQLVGQGHGI